MQNPKVCILRGAGTNCDKETAFAFEKAGAKCEFVHINTLARKDRILSAYQILAIPGGFSYGDDVGAGKILANELKYKLIADVKKFIRDGKLIIGICNGFQVLVKSGLLAGNRDFSQDTSLIINDSGKFEDRWVYLSSRFPPQADQPTAGTVESSQPKCVWARGLPEVIYLPVAHGEGKFLTQDKPTLERLKKNRQIVFQYCDREGKLGSYPYNPNGSIENIAGICDDTGRILGLMPHPERHIISQQHPRWAGREAGDGFQIFRNGVEYFRRK